MTIYQDLIAAGIECSNWQSDLYFPANETTKQILDKYPGAYYSVFKSNRAIGPMYEVPFGFDPYWQPKEK